MGGIGRLKAWSGGVVGVGGEGLGKRWRDGGRLGKKGDGELEDGG